MKILIVEDDFISRSLLKNMLEASGHDVVAAEDGQAAWGIIQKNDIRMVITDWMMPKMDGLALCRKIRQGLLVNYVYIIILTAKDTKGDIIHGLEAGADDFLSKPFNHTELVARLKCGKRILDLEKSLQDANIKIMALSNTDPLTGCFNKRYLEANLPGEIKRARRYRRSFSVVMSDIDFFKEINDTFGHPAGDRVLKEFAERMQESIREGVDWITRYGGEEFLIVLPETGVSGACRLAERVCKAIFLLPFAGPERNLQISASFGVTGFDSDTPENIISAESLIHQADMYLYQSKQDGRNRVTAGPLANST